jgi:hypothetical protein
MLVDDSALVGNAVIGASGAGAIVFTPPGGVHPVRCFFCVERATENFVAASTFRSAVSIIFSCTFACGGAALLGVITIALGFSAASAEIARGFTKGMMFGGGVELFPLRSNSDGIG